MRCAFGVVVLFCLTVSAALAQTPGSDAQRNCQTLVNCQFKKGGSYRGCISSYSCRVCRLVAERCTIAGQGNCRRFVCSWG